MQLVRSTFVPLFFLFFFCLSQFSKAFGGAGGNNFPPDIHFAAWIRENRLQNAENDGNDRIATKNVA
jgi:hypothetical protein